MKKPALLIVTAVVLLALGTAPALATAADDMQKRIDALDLTGDQKSRIDKIFKEQRGRAADMLKQSRDKISTLLTPDQKDKFKAWTDEKLQTGLETNPATREKNLRELVNELGLDDTQKKSAREILRDLGKNLGDVKGDLKDSVKAVLTPDQLKKFKEMA